MTNYMLTLEEWRKQAYRVLTNPQSTMSQRVLAWRFLKSHGVKK
jgi:hypothetical protein